MISFRNPSAQFASVVTFLAAAFWGIYWIPLRYLESQGIEGLSAVALLNAPALLPLLVLVTFTWKKQSAYWRETCLIGLCTGLGIALYSSGVVYSSVVRATLFFYLTPVWATLIEIFWFKERVSWSRWGAVVIGLTGMVLLLSGGEVGEQSKGDILAFFSGIFWALGASMVRRYDQVPIPGMAFGQFLATALGALLIGFLFDADSLVKVKLSVGSLAVVLFASLVILMPIVVAIFWGQKVINPGRAGLLMMSEVMVAVISASIILPDERMGIIEWGGAVLILSACFIEVFTAIQPKQSDRPST